MRARLPDGTPTFCSTMRRGRVAGRWPSFEPRDALKQRGERRRRTQHQLGERVAAAARLDEPSRRCSRWLRACTSQARRRSAGSTAARRTDRRRTTTRVIGEDRAELERKGVERRSNSCAATSSGVPRPASCQAATRPRRRADRRRSGRRRRPAWACDRRRQSRRVHDQRPQAIAEDRSQVAIERVNRVGNVHASIVECARCACAS